MTQSKQSGQSHQTQVQNQTSDISPIESKPKKKRLPVYKPIKGYAWNPMAKYPRNAPCFCGKTLKKAKHCCLPKLNPAIPDKAAEGAKQYLKDFHERLNKEDAE